MSMNQRAQLQLRLQETVEGLSIVTISYYAIGLIGIGFKVTKAAGYPVDVGVLTGLSIPIVMVGAFLLIRRIRRLVLKVKIES